MSLELAAIAAAPSLALTSRLQVAPRLPAAFKQEKTVLLRKAFFIMDLRKLKTLIDLVSESGVAELEITEGEDRVRIVNNHGAQAPVHGTSTVILPAEIPPQANMPAPAATTITPAPIPEAPAGKPLNSPMVGTFYRSPSPGADPFVEVGDTVKKGQVVAIIEAMKLLNEVEAEEDGVVREICVENGQPVEFGQPLFILE